MRENRHVRRWRLIHHLRVFDRESDAVLGHVVDITVGGMMLVSVDPIAIDRDYEVRMALPGSGQPPEVRLRMRALWQGTHEDADFHVTGFRLVDPCEEATARIRELVEELRFPGGSDVGGIREDPPNVA